MTDGSAASVAGRGAYGHMQFEELLNGGSDGCHVALYIFYFFQPAAHDCISCNVLHDYVSTPPA